MAVYFSMLLRKAVLLTCSAAIIPFVAFPDSPLQNNTNGNTILRAADGRIYIVADHVLYRSANPEGDRWDPVLKQVSNIALDPTNTMTLYATTQQMAV
jgi:hypothetical protein